MKEEINKVLDMVKNGILSSEQATQLIQAINDSSKKAEQQFQKAKESVGGFLSETLQSTISAVKSAGIFNEDQEHNAVTLSKFSAPGGTDFTFTDNSINLSNVHALTLEASKFIDNSINGSKLENLSFKNSEFMDNGIHASSLDGFESDDSKWIDTQINGSRISALKLSAKSSLTDCQFNACNLKNTVFENVQLSDAQLNACNFNRVTLRNVNLADLKLNRLELNDQEIDGTEAFRQIAKI